MKEDHIPNYKKYKSEDLLDVWTRIDRRNNPKKFGELKKEIKIRFNIANEIDLNNEDIRTKIVSKLKEEDPERFSKYSNKKEYFLSKKIINIFSNLFLIPALYFFFTKQIKTAVLIFLLSISLISITSFIISFRTGIILDQTKDIYEEKQQKEFFSTQVFYYIIFLIGLSISALILFDVISF